MTHVFTHVLRKSVNLMASYRKLPSGKWRAEVFTNGIRKSKSFATKPEAQIWALETEAELAGGKNILSGKTVAEALSRYAEEVSPTKKGERWERVRAIALARMELGSMSLESLSTQVMNKWIAERGKSVSPSTVNRELNFLSSVFEYCVTHWRWLKANPIKGTQKPKNPPPRDRRISDTEIKRILLALDDFNGEVITLRHEIAVGFLLALETAMRQSELWGLTWENVYLEQNYVHLPITKNGTSRDVPLSSRAVELLTLMAESQQPIGRVFKSNQKSVGTIFRRAVQMAGLINFTFHDTRHEALTRLARKIDVLDLARMVGHRDPRSLMIYYNATASEIASRLG